MAVVILLVILALLLGGVGLAVDTLRWLLIIGLVLLIASIVFGFRSRSTY